MSKIKNNPLLKGASGMLGNVVVYREARGRMVMANRPKKNEELTEHQVKTKKLFLRAVQYAKAQVANPVTKAEYEAGITNRKFSAYTVAVTDYLTPPAIDAVDTSRYQGAAGDVLAITASDDFKVVSVQVTITSSTGDLIEQGEAQLQPDTVDDWRYMATAANATLAGTTIAIAVRDKPGNVTVAEIVLE